jgi:phosphotriesterase-related protein
MNPCGSTTPTSPVRSHPSFFGGHGFGFLLDDFVPRLLKAGLGQDTVDTITRHNPSRAVAF